MDFEFTDDQLALRDAARTVLAGACPPSVPRAILDGGDAADADEAAGVRGRLWSTLRDLDWPAVGIAEAAGGVGLGAVEVAVLAEELARAAAPTPLLATSTQYVPIVRLAGAHDRLSPVASGEVTGTLALAEAGRWDLDSVAATARLDGDAWVISGSKDAVFDGATADRLAVVARGEAGLGVFDVARGAVLATAINTIDPTQPLASIELREVRVGAEAVLIAPGARDAEAAIARAVDEATALWCVSSVATCRTIFEMTVQYAKDREQFGRPIGSFQAIKHRLADAFLAVERASALAYFATLTVAEDDPRRTVAVSMAKSAAGDCQRLLTRDGLQLHGGVGYTWEHDLHLWLKRAAMSELVFGTSAWHRARLARAMGLVAEEAR